jgi:hypothetical protein
MRRSSGRWQRWLAQRPYWQQCGVVRLAATALLVCLVYLWYAVRGRRETLTTSGFLLALVAAAGTVVVVAALRSGAVVAWPSLRSAVAPDGAVREAPPVAVLPSLTTAAVVKALPAPVPHDGSASSLRLHEAVAAVQSQPAGDALLAAVDTLDTGTAEPMSVQRLPSGSSWGSLSSFSSLSTAAPHLSLSHITTQKSPSPSLSSEFVANESKTNDADLFLIGNHRRSPSPVVVVVRSDDADDEDEWLFSDGDDNDDETEGHNPIAGSSSFDSAV